MIAAGVFGSVDRGTAVLTDDNGIFLFLLRFRIRFFLFRILLFCICAVFFPLIPVISPLLSSHAPDYVEHNDYQNYRCKTEKTEYGNRCQNGYYKYDYFDQTNPFHCFLLNIPVYLCEVLLSVFRNISVLLLKALYTSAASLKTVFSEKIRNLFFRIGKIRNGVYGIRTRDLPHAKRTLSQLS